MSTNFKNYYDGPAQTEYEEVAALTQNCVKVDDDYGTDSTHFTKDIFPDVEMWSPSVEEEYRKEMSELFVINEERRKLYIKEFASEVGALVAKVSAHFHMVEEVTVQHSVVELTRGPSGLFPLLSMEMLQIFVFYTAQCFVNIEGETMTVEVALRRTCGSFLHPGQDFMFWALFDQLHGTQTMKLMRFPKTLLIMRKNSDVHLKPLPIAVPGRVNMQFMVTGPHPEDIVFSPVDKILNKFVPNFVTVWDGKEYCFVAGPVASVGVEIEPTVRAWLHCRLKDLSPKGSYMDTRYYVGNMAYESTIGELHKQMLESISTLVPEKSTVLAPGDGQGVVKQVFVDRVVSSSDICPPYYAKEVNKRTIRDAILESIDEYVILSYVSGFLSKDDWELLGTPLLSGVKRKVIILDSHPVLIPSLGEPLYQSYCITLYGLEPVERGAVKDDYSTKNVLYTENLLKCRELHLKTFDRGVRYLRSMVPGRTYTCDNWLKKYFLSAGLQIVEGRFSTNYVSSVKDWLNEEEWSEQWPMSRDTYVYRLGCIPECDCLHFSTMVRIEPRKIYELDFELNGKVPKGIESVEIEGVWYAWCPHVVDRVFYHEKSTAECVENIEWCVTSRRDKSNYFYKQGKNFKKLTLVTTDENFTFKLGQDGQVLCEESDKYLEYIRSYGLPRGVVNVFRTLAKYLCDRATKHLCEQLKLTNSNTGTPPDSNAMKT